MERLRKGYLFLKEKYELLSFKRYTTLAGTLVFFLIMSITPLSFWLTLLIGRLPVDVEEVLALPVFDAVKDILIFVQREAESAATSVSVLLLVTSAYSATNLFYQMRRSGEIIYDYHRGKEGWRLRLSALALMFVLTFVVFFFVSIFALGSYFFMRIFSPIVAQIAEYILLAVLSFALVLLFNIYVCPYKTPIKKFIKGTFITVIAWALAIVGFTIYLKIGNMARLYGALSIIIVFFLWLYLLMIGFIVGVIFNSESILPKKKSRKKKKSA